MTNRSKEREEFLSDLLITAIEHGGYGFSQAVEYEPEPDGNPAGSYAVIYDRYDLDDSAENEATLPRHRVDIDLIAKGLGIVRKLAKRPEGISDWVKELLLADRTNGDEGDYDVVGALLVLECAIYGKPTYA